MVRHLLLLKEMTQNLDFATKDSDRTLDLTGVTGQIAFIVSLTVGSYLYRYAGIYVEQNYLIAAECSLRFSWNAKGREHG